MLFYFLALCASIIAVAILRKTLSKDYDLIGVSIFTIVIIFVISTLIGAVITSIYYSTELPNCYYDKIDLHPESSISIEQYINQEPIVLMDKDYNLYHIDLDKAEVTFSSNNTAFYIKTIEPKGIWKFIVLYPSRTSYAIQFMDYYARYSYK